MAIVEIDWHPDRRRLRQFAAIALGVCLAVGLDLAMGWWPFRYAGGWALPGVVWALGGVLLALGLTYPPGVRPFYLTLMVVSWPIGWVLSHAMLALLYFGVFTPIALWFRLVGRDPLCRRFDPEAETYWIRRPEPPRAARYFRQF